MQLAQMKLQAEVMLFVKSKYKKRASRNVENYYWLTLLEVREPETVRTMTRIEE